MTGDEVRALCLSLPETTEKETWGDDENPGHPTFRVKDKIFVIMAVDGSGGVGQRRRRKSRPRSWRRSRTRRDTRAYTGRYGWVDLDFAGIPDEVLRETIEGAWATDRPEEARLPVAGRPMTAIAPPAAAGAAPTTGPRARTRPPARAGSPPPSPGARADGRAALIPYVVAGYPDADTSFAAALAAADAGADLLEVGLPYSDPLADGATLQRASGVALAAGATLERSLRLIERIGAARPDLPARPDGLRQPGHRRRRRRGRGERLAGAGAAGLIVADLTPDEGGAVRGGRPRGRPRGRLPRGADDAARDGGPRSPPAAAASSTASRSSASPAPGRRCRPRSAAWSAT